MTYVLGIDTGGTFTDAVVVDLNTKEILAETKSETTHFHLIEGISKAIGQLDFDRYDEVEYASLSTTLATNAIVEGRGCRVGLIVLGFEPKKELPTCELRVLPGAIDMHGGVVEPLDLEKTKEAVESLRDKVDAVAVSGILSIRNPILENQVKDMVRDILGLPCVAAHELSSVLGMQERTVTAALNARLISVIDDLILAVKAALAEKGMDIPVMIVKGDGSLMTEDTARYRPIETILSGPAASIIGATFLNGVENGLILDMGGTTTDIAIMKNGRPRIDERGASVGGWRTRVAAAEVNTFGLGGDSRIYLDMQDGKVKVGPRRVYPISAVTAFSEDYFRELTELSMKAVGLRKYEVCEGFIMLRDQRIGMDFSTTQFAVLREIENGPHTIRYISEKIGVDPDFINMDLLIERGIVAPVGFTPTDILHVTGEYVHGDADGAKLAFSLMARRWAMTEDEALELMRGKITHNLTETIRHSLFSYEKIDEDAEASSQVNAILKNAFYGENSDLLSVLFRLNMPVLGIGAPIRAWLKPAVDKFHTETVFPEHYNVANAVGAAAGKVMHIYKITVQNHEIDGVHVYAPWGRVVFGCDEEEEHSAEDITSEQMHIGNNYKNRSFIVEQAVTYAIDEATRRLKAEMEGVNEDYEILVERRDRTTHHGYSENLVMFLESQVEVVAVVKPF